MKKENPIKTTVRVLLAQRGGNWSSLARDMKVSRPTITNHMQAGAVNHAFLLRVLKTLSVTEADFWAEVRATMDTATGRGRKPLPPLVTGKRVWNPLEERSDG